MKKLILCLSIVAMFVCVSSQAWAMGKRGGSGGNNSRSNHSGGSNSGSQSQNNYSQNNQSQNDHSQGNGAEQGQGGHEDFSGSQGNGFIPETDNFQFASDDEKFPAATPVPEPATMSLMGMGLASFLLARKKN